VHEVTGPLRVAHVISASAVIGGAERVLISLVEEGQARGCEQLVLNPFASSAVDTPLRRAVSPVRYIGIPCRTLAGVPWLRRVLNQEVRDFRPDVLHAHLFQALVATASLPRRGEVRVLSHQHGGLLQSQGRRLEARIDRLAGRRFDRIVACSEDVRRFLENEYRYPPGRLLTIYNGWAGDPPDQSGLAARPTALCIANLRPEKGHAVLLRAWAEVVRQVPDAELVLVGGGPLESSLRAEVGWRALTDHVTFAGTLDSVWGALAQAHVFVLASHHEPFGIVAAEAMAAGVPVVASAVGGLSELVQNGVSGILVPPGDAVPLAAALVQLLTSPDTRARLGAAGRVRAAKFTVDQTVTDYFDLYESTRR
jgi:glycosyltransferase involved in cell wall biosynthesis